MKNESIYIFERAFPNGHKKIIEMTETQAIKYMRRAYQYPIWKRDVDVIADFLATHWAMEKSYRSWQSRRQRV